MFDKYTAWSLLLIIIFFLPPHPLLIWDGHWRDWDKNSVSVASIGLWQGVVCYMNLRRLLWTWFVALIIITLNVKMFCAGVLRGHWLVEATSHTGLDEILWEQSASEIRQKLRVEPWLKRLAEENEMGGGEWGGMEHMLFKRVNKEKEAAETRFVQAKGVKVGGMGVASSGKEERGWGGPGWDRPLDLWLGGWRRGCFFEEVMCGERMDVKHLAQRFCGYVCVFPPNYLPLLGTMIKSRLAPSSCNSPTGLPFSIFYLGGTLLFRETATKAYFAEEIVWYRENLVSTGCRKV